MLIIKINSLRRNELMNLNTCNNLPDLYGTSETNYDLFLHLVDMGQMFTSNP